MSDPRLGDRRVDEDGVEWIYAGKAGWQRIVQPDKWNNLTKDEILDVICRMLQNPKASMVDFGRAIEAACKEKNKVRYTTFEKVNYKLRWKVGNEWETSTFQSGAAASKCFAQLTETYKNVELVEVKTTTVDTVIKDYKVQ